eukprot:TRINITY_DN29486_c0_g1_i1.p1 TRINITY_DN29486_c0_g1~~TRINITY_DN29486_c0_g1_i1.p1  ORF type:complete len:296 (-),score=44.20 TRINITY_DN29486_c0_g1_i1:336-1223(-)
MVEHISFHVQSRFSEESPFGYPSSPVQSPCFDLPVVKTVFLVRHGEAVHNIAEKHARHNVSREVPIGDETVEERVEKARKAALQCASFKDAPLSDLGKEQAETSRAKIEELLAADPSLKAPEVVYVSPLQRTLQTASIVFPGHDEIHVREVLRERCTGFPCDMRSSVFELQGRQTFQHMSFDQLRRIDRGACKTVGGSGKHLVPPSAHQRQVEDKHMLRLRAAKLQEVLLESEASSICIVTHKGFLRELERGPLGREEASEFDNCEVRLYDIVCHSDGTMTALLRHAGMDACETS